jgi:histidinol-phosphatase (PHP family)
LSTDFHTHTFCSPDSSTPVTEVLEMACKRGLHGIAITDHAEMGPSEFGFLSPYCRSYEEYKRAVGSVAECYEDRLRVFLGVEVGYRIEYDAMVREFLGKHEFDVVIGSIHDSPPVDWWDPHAGELLRQDPESGVGALQWYFTQLEAAARTGLFDIIAHIDVYERYVPGMWPDPFSHPRIAPLARRAVEAIAKHSRMEINLAMLNRDGNFAWSALRFLEMYREMGGKPPVTGSDAHRPAWVGLNLKAGEELARKAGFAGVASWEEVVPRFRAR